MPGSRAQQKVNPSPQPTTHLEISRLDMDLMMAEAIKIDGVPVVTGKAIHPAFATAKRKGNAKPDPVEPICGNHYAHSVPRLAWSGDHYQ